MGRNAEQRLRASGIEAKRVNPSRSLMVPRSALRMAPAGHVLHDPRSLDGANLEMAADMAARVQGGQEPNHRAILVRDEGVDESTGLRVLLVVDGHGRTLASGEAERILLRAGVLSSSEDLYVRVDFFEGDDAAVIEERIRRNDHDRFQRRDSASVLAFRVRQLRGLGRSVKEIAAVCPREVGPAEIDALGRFENLSASLRARFDAGAPLGLLAAVLDASPDERAALLDSLEAKGLKSSRGATRARNTEREREGEPRPVRLPPRKCLEVSKAIRSAPVLALPNGEADFARGMATAFAMMGGAPRPGKVPAPILKILKAARGKGSRVST